MIKLVGLMLGVAAVTFLIFACTPDAPEIRAVDVELQLGSAASVFMEPDFIEIKQDDTLILNVVSYQKGMLHIHGYDLALMVDQVGIAVLEFEAIATGRFEVMFHTAGPAAIALPENSREGSSDETSNDEDDHHSGDGYSSDESAGHLMGYLQVMPR
jgi:hypothetical protein